jgi:hypothetical protein
MAVVRNALEIAGLTVSVLLIVIGGGLTGDPVVLMMLATGLSLSLTLAALAASWRKPGRAPIG